MVKPILLTEFHAPKPLGVITVCSNLKVLYLQGNSITKIENLHIFNKLTHLYLQDNKISRIENLEKLINLEKLFIGHNCITVVEGLENLKQLKELHLEQQNLPPGEALQFDPRTMESLSETLLLLDISKNELNSLWDICLLKSLVELHARGNKFQSIPGVCEPLSTLPNLQILDLSGNEICSFPKYRDAVMMSASQKLEWLDNKKLYQVTREFVQNFEIFKKQQSVTVIPQNDFPGLVTSDRNESKEISDLTLCNNLPTKPGLAAITSLFPPWSLKRTVMIRSQKKPTSSFQHSSNTVSDMNIFHKPT
ncbi:protein phosphatase 1 regulatory subunit 42-like [Hetaerina americana]|uniref:protein phosphatase 1 regulatory subunit 42-like n=1 Tax=Hetaerina americana TaxID=62018 RepID=UPI003A7F2BE3